MQLKNYCQFNYEQIICFNKRTTQWCPQYCNLFAEIHCGPMVTPTKGSQVASNDVMDAVATFSCDRGYRLTGSTQRTCTETGNWNGSETDCVGQLIFSLE